MSEKDARLVGTSGAARVAECSESAMRTAADRSELPSQRTESGFRVYRLEDVKKFAQERRERRAR
jgi:hypothetical protein